MGKTQKGIEMKHCDIGASGDIPVTIIAASSLPYSLPERKKDSNKGTYGRVLIVGGSVGMAGAAYLSGMAAYRCGAGLVNIFTPDENRVILQTLLPEAILTTYSLDDESKIYIRLKEAIASATVVVIGPGLSTSNIAKSILKAVLDYTDVPLIIDADALNIISEDASMWSLIHTHAVITPHMGEMSRLTKTSVAELKENAPDTALCFSKDKGVVCVMKDSRTCVAYENKLYINLTGNSGLSKGGSGDTLTGIIAGLCASGMGLFEACCSGVYLHGLAADIAKADFTEYSMLARDVCNYIPAAIKQSTEESGEVE